MDAAAAAEPLSVEHFRNILALATGSLTELCEKWAQSLEAAEPSSTTTTGEEPHEQEEFLGAVRSTIGQAKLLMSQRFKQFADLIDHCEFQTGPMPTRLNDLSGFWEMISFQVEDVLQKFAKLEEQRRRQAAGELAMEEPASGKGADLAGRAHNNNIVN